MKFDVCESCGQKLKDLNIYDGRLVSCPNCHAVLRVHSLSKYYTLESKPSRFNWDPIIELEKGD